MISTKKFFFDFFPGAYMCAMAQGGGQFEGRLMNNFENLKSDLAIYQELNKSRYNIYFTPNGGSTAEGRNSLSNLAKINAWWIDIDIDETKMAGDDEESQILREERKSEIRGKIFVSDLWPSLTIETRNGFQLYWLADDSDSSNLPTTENWSMIGESIYDFYKMVGADHSTVKIMQLMRVPNFYYFKHGEFGKILIDFNLSTFEKIKESTMIQFFPPTVKVFTPEELRIKPKFYKPKYQNIVNSDDIFKKIVDLPIDEVLLKLSGHWLVNGENIIIQKQNTEKSNILVDGRMSPNFIDRTQNHIYSNNASVKGPTIIQYLDWYFPGRRGLIAKGLKEVFMASR